MKKFKNIDTGGDTEHIIYADLVYEADCRVLVDSHPCINPTWPKIPRGKLHGYVVSTSNTR